MARQRIESQEAFEARRLALLPSSWAGRLRRVFDGKARAGGLRSANEYLLGYTEPFEHLALPMSATDADIVAIAERKAGDMMSLAGSFPGDVAAIRDRLAARVVMVGMVPPDVMPNGKRSDMLARSAVARMTCAHWWRRRLRAVHARQIEGAAIGLGFVHAGKGARTYCSDVSLRRRMGQKARNAAGLAATMAINEDGESFALAELAERSVANPRIRRGELMTRIRGFEEIAKGLGHAADFWTITCPSRMHARLHGTGAENPAYDGTTPKGAQQYLGRVWSRIRAKLARRGVTLYGFRIAEPHHDATPHWHMLVFFVPAWPGVAGRLAAPRIRAIVRRYALADSGTERGARKYRAKFVAIDPKRGTAAGYIAKYVAKNIDGYGVGNDLFGGPAIESSARVEAWASTWGIRQFQQFGGPPVGVWRELRRIETAEGVAEEARSAADVGNWRRYVEVMGGPCVARKDMPLQIARVAAYRTEAAPGWFGRWLRVPALKGREGRYHEVGIEVVGVLDCLVGRVVESVRRVWRIVSRRAGGLLTPWTCVNNCTGVEDGKETGSAASQDRGSENGLGVPQAGTVRGGGGNHDRSFRRFDRQGKAGQGEGGGKWLNRPARVHVSLAVRASLTS